MKKILVIVLISFGIYAYQNSQSVVVVPVVVASPDISAQRVEYNVADSPSIALRQGAVYGTQNSGNQIQGAGKVVRILSDENDGSRHQRFIIELQSGQTLLVAHNIDLAPRIAGLSVNDSIEFNGEYEWNSQGGMVHWTHHDPDGRHQEGWLKHRGRTYK